MAAPPVFLLAGALAGACASGLTTPFDVLKTRVSDKPLQNVIDLRQGDEGPTGTTRRIRTAFRRSFMDCSGLRGKVEKGAICSRVGVFRSLPHWADGAPRALPK